MIAFAYVPSARPRATNIQGDCNPATMLTRGLASPPAKPARWSARKAPTTWKSAGNAPNHAATAPTPAEMLRRPNHERDNYLY